MMTFSYVYKCVYTCTIYYHITIHIVQFKSIHISIKNLLNIIVYGNINAIENNID